MSLTDEKLFPIRSWFPLIQVSKISLNLTLWNQKTLDLETWQAICST